MRRTSLIVGDTARALSDQATRLVVEHSIGITPAYGALTAWALVQQGQIDSGLSQMLHGFCASPMVTVHEFTVSSPITLLNSSRLVIVCLPMVTIQTSMRL